MIASVDENSDFVKTLAAMSGADPFACRIISLYNSYSPKLAFVDYWLIIGGNMEFTGAAARSGTSFVLFLTDKTDLEEVESFVRVTGAESVLCDARFRLNLSAGRQSEGVVMSRQAPILFDESAYRFVKPDIRDAYYLILRCKSSSFNPPPFDEFYVDVNHKLRHGTMRMYGVSVKNRLAAIAMTVAECDGAAVLGAVACDPDFRKSGYGSAIVSYITNQLAGENRTVFLHRAQNVNAAFYSELGFEQTGEWREYYFR